MGWGKEPYMWIYGDIYVYINSNILATWCEEPTHWKRLWCLERLQAGEGDDRGWNDWLASKTQWIWVWVNQGNGKGQGSLSSVQSCSRVQLFVTPWTGACQASLSITNSRSSPKLMFIESVMPSNHLIVCRPLLLLPSIFPSIRVFSNESVLHISGQSTRVSASASLLPMNTQDWSPLGWTGWISLQSKGLSRVFSSTTVQKH